LGFSYKLNVFEFALSSRILEMVTLLSSRILEVVTLGLRQGRRLSVDKKPLRGDEEIFL